jgi:hypothetical protein
MPFSAIAQISGVTITPVGATASDTITITVNTNQICPTASANAGQSLSGASVVRLHAGLRVNGVNFVNTVSANSDAAATAYTGFTNLGGGIWQKRILPTAYFQPVTGTIEGITFVLNGGPTGGNPWEREGKVCGANGFPAANGDFIVPFPLSGAITGPRLGISLTLPTVDTVVRGGNIITFRTNAVDSNGVAIERVVFYADGNIVQTVRNAPYEFTWNTPINPDTLVFTAEVFSVGGASRLSNAISVRVLEPVSPAIGIRLTLPSADTTVKVGDSVTLLALVADTNNTGISGVEFFSNSNLLRTRITTPPYTLTLPKGDTSTTVITARVFGTNGESVLSNGINISAERPYYYNSGVAIYSANGLASEPLDIRVVPVFTCPTPAVNAGGSLGDATIVRIHAGIKVGRNGGDFQRVVNAESSPTASAITGFTNNNGVWFKSLTPNEYFNITGTDTIAQMNFVLNGGPVNGNPWEREGKVCGTNGQPAAGAAGNFNVPFNLPAFQAPRIGVQITRPTADTTVSVGSIVLVNAIASDSAGRLISSVVLNVDGVPVDTITTAPYRFTLEAPSSNGTFALTATAFGANGASATSDVRNITVTGAPTAPRLAINWVSPAADTAIAVNSGFNALVNAVDSTSQPISVTFLADGVEVGTDNEAPYTYVFNAGQFNDTVLLQARVNGLFSTSLLSDVRQVIVNGAQTPLFSGSGVTITPLGATGNDTITITVDPRATCPTTAYFAGASLLNAPIVRLHSGVRIGINGTYWSNFVGATGTPANNAITGFTRLPNGLWIKKIVPRTYYNVPVNDTVTGFSFILGGGPEGDVFSREGKLCDGGGGPIAGGAGDFLIPLAVPTIETPRLAVNIVRPLTDTTVQVGSSITVEAIAADTTGQPIEVAFWVNGVRVSTDNTAPYNYVLNAGPINDTFEVQAQVLGLLGSSALSTIRTVRVTGQVFNLFSGSGVTVTPPNATGRDTITITVDPRLTCPTSAFSAGSSLQDATIIRLHSGVKIGRNGTFWNNLVGATGTSENNLITGFTLQPNGTWVKQIVPSTYFNVPATDTVTGFSFVLNGGPDGSPWNREGKQCGVNGAPAAGGAGDFLINLNEPGPVAPRLAVAITLPTADTTIQVETPVSINVNAIDSLGQPLKRVILWVNGVRYDTITMAPYNFTWTAPARNGSFAFAAQVIGALDSSLISAVRTINVIGEPITPQLGVTWVNPAADTTIRVEASFTANVNAIDTTNQTISVSFLVDGAVVATDSTAPFSYTYTAGSINDTVTLQARVNGLYSTSLLSSTRQVIINGQIFPIFAGSGVTITPLGATGRDTVTITVDPRFTCPTSAFNAASSLQDATAIRLHSGVRIGRNGTFWNNVVNATSDSAQTVLTGFTQQANGTWVKKFVPSTYFNVPATDTVTGFSFVLNGGPVGGNPWAREGKQCGTNGAPAAGGAGDFLINLSEPAPVAPILSVNISTPSADTSVEVGSIISVNVQATDATNQRISRVVLWVNGSRFDTLNSAPYLFTYEAPATNGTYTIQAQVFGANDSNAVSAIRTITVTGQAITPQLGINWINPAADTTIRVETSFTANVNAIDTTNQTISVSFLVDGSVVATDSTAPFSYTYTAASINDTVTLQARVNGRFGTSLLSSTRQVIINGQILPIFAGSGVTITPLGATGRDTITITVDPRFTCPTSAFNAGSSLQDATIIRLHSGVRIGRNGTFWNSVVGATGTPANNLITGFTQQANGTWVKRIVPSTYFNVPATDTVTGFSFVLNGGPDGSPWNREGKQCGINGAPAVGAAADFLINLSIPAPTAPRLSATITTPTADTSVQVASVVNIRVQAIDSTSQRISRVVLWVNGTRTDTVTAAPYNFVWNAPATNGQYTIQTQVFGAYDSSAVSAIRTITVTGQAVTPRLSINWIAPATDATVSVNTNYTAEVLATDTTGQPISVSFWIDGVQVSEVTTPPYTFSFNTGTVNDTLNLTARVNGVLGANLVSPNRQLTITGQAASLFEGSGVRVTPAGATGNDTITITVDPRFTCPTSTANAATSLFGAPVIRLHSGVKVGRNGANFTRVVAANADSAQTALTGFTRQINGTWVKRLVPRTYYSVPTNDTIVALNFVMNGGPVGGNPWAREGKVCGTNGQPAVGNAADFFAPLALPPFTLVTPRIAVRVSLPTSDTIVRGGASFPIRVTATDSTNQAIERTIIRVDGVEVANVLGGSININYTALNVADTLSIQAEAIGAQGVSRLSNIINVIVEPLSVKNLAAMGISVYPNPTSATLTINSKSEMVKSVQIKDVSGKVVYTASPNALQSELNVSGLTNGFYLVEIATEKGTSVARIVKQ